ncbi:hypothetical protein H0H81_011523 [Sphagnurus paluster]|uniref:F-box domain-containing protein n=1 Tax=Sphagnurus paluster TaxID=117069 RepID=A0A9P7KJD4_9AGAR|nr:hypothetical protein H0H81_011523 [Sphagnurus paluster]
MKSLVSNTGLKPCSLASPILNSNNLNIFHIPIEVIERILVLCCPRDVIAFSGTSRLAHMIVFDFSNQHLWRELFFSLSFDDPCYSQYYVSSDASPIDWRRKTIERLTTEWTIMSPWMLSNHTSSILQTFIDMVYDLPPLYVRETMRAPSRNVGWLEQVFRTSEVLNVDTEMPRREAMLYSQLRAYVSLSLDKGDADETKSGARLETRRKRGRLYVYNFRNYFGRHWGPFLDSGNADWIHIEHLVNVMVMNLRQLPGIWRDIQPPLGLAACRPFSAPMNGRETPTDWARVEGK